MGLYPTRATLTPGSAGKKRAEQNNQNRAPEDRASGSRSRECIECGGVVRRHLRQHVNPLKSTDV